MAPAATCDLLRMLNTYGIRSHSQDRAPSTYLRAPGRESGLNIGKRRAMAFWVTLMQRAGRVPSLFRALPPPPLGVSTPVTDGGHLVYSLAGCGMGVPGRFGCAACRPLYLLTWIRGNVRISAFPPCPNKLRAALRRYPRLRARIAPLLPLPRTHPLHPAPSPQHSSTRARPRTYLTTRCCNRAAATRARALCGYPRSPACLAPLPASRYLSAPATLPRASKTSYHTKPLYLPQYLLSILFRGGSLARKMASTVFVLEHLPPVPTAVANLHAGWLCSRTHLHTHTDGRNMRQYRISRPLLRSTASRNSGVPGRHELLASLG